MSAIDEFFRELDARWEARDSERVRLRVIGSGALMMQFDYERGTKDSDVLDTTELSSPTRDRLLVLAGRETELHRRTRLYLDIVPNGLPLLPSPPIWHAIPALRDLAHFEVHALDVIDVVVSKLKRFNANDQDDIRAMVEAERVPRDALIERFRSAFTVFSYDARAADLHRYVGNLNQVERDLIGVDETDFTTELDALRY